MSIWSTTTSATSKPDIWSSIAIIQFETIEPVGPEIVTQPRLIRQTVDIDSKMLGDDLADLDGNVVIHGLSVDEADRGIHVSIQSNDHNSPFVP